MRRAWLRGGLGFVAISIVVLAAACAPPAPKTPPTPAPGQLSLNPTSLSFPPGSASTMPNLAVTVTNTGGQSVQSFAVSSTNGVYSLPTNTCAGATLAPGQSCMVVIQFCPGGTLGQFPATLAVSAMSGGTPLSVTEAMNGTGT